MNPIFGKKTQSVNQNKYSAIFWFILFSIAPFARAQHVDHGFSIGLSFSFGTEVNRIGIHGAAYLTYQFAQLNIGTNAMYNFKSLGLEKKTLEFQAGAGLQFGFGKKDTVYNNFIGLTENNTFHDLCGGLAYIKYWDQQQTSQATGLLSFNAYNFTLSTENDLFGNLIHQTDRFRTGAFLLSYQYRNTKIGIETVLWTHDYEGCKVITKNGETDWARFGYYHDDSAQNRSHSLGLLSVRVEQWLPYQQKAQLNIGVNSEKVRNAIQNEFIHDQPFFPDLLVKRKPPHIPMFTNDGQQYLYQPDQVIKPTQFYFNLGLNTLSFY